jgi:hypothetical protein
VNSRSPRKVALVLSDEETRLWHSIFSRELRELHRAQIIERCEKRARAAGSAEYAIYDAYEPLVARGSNSPAV